MDPRGPIGNVEISEVCNLPLPGLLVPSSSVEEAHLYQHSCITINSEGQDQAFSEGFTWPMSISPSLPLALTKTFFSGFRLGGYKLIK